MHLYIHIPFCKKACHYCDFHFSTNLSRQDEMVDSICKEIAVQRNFLQNKSLETIYFGGGTPSLLSSSQLQRIMDSIAKYFSLTNLKEVTFEANPDDINAASLKSWKKAGVNRLSVGVQSFDDTTLQFMNRAHSSREAINALQETHSTFGSNISFDLIYTRNATVFDENQQNELLLKDIEILASFDINHVSAYSLTIENKTAMAKWIEKGTLMNVPEAYAERQFKIVTEGLQKLGFEQYEIASFTKNKAYAIHNTAYWQNKPYLGVGPGAHSFDGENRFANVANNQLYLKGLAENKLTQTKEILSEKDKFNDLVLCGLRTIWGLDLDLVKDKSFLNTTFWEAVNFYTQKQMLSHNNNTLIITPKGRIMADAITADLFA